MGFKRGSIVQSFHRKCQHPLRTTSFRGGYVNGRNHANEFLRGRNNRFGLHTGTCCGQGLHSLQSHCQYRYTVYGLYGIAGG